MANFCILVKNVLEEQGKTTEDLFNDKVISSSTFYKFKYRQPSISSIVKIANYLKVTVDYLLELTHENNFVKYSVSQKGLSKNIMRLVHDSHLSDREFCRQIGFAKDTPNNWKKGMMPRLNMLLEISKFFKCPIDDLLEKEKSA